MTAESHSAAASTVYVTASVYCIFKKKHNHLRFTIFWKNFIFLKNTILVLKCEILYKDF